MLHLTSYVHAQKGEDLIQLKVQTFEHLDKKLLAIKVELEKGWHVYWKNPGDSGIATEWKFKTQKNSLSLEMMEWPSPTLYKEAGDLWTFGYSGEKYFFATIQNQNPQDDELTLTADFLVCKELCIPAKLTISFDILKGELKIPEELNINAEKSFLQKQLETLPQAMTLPTNWEWRLYQLKDSTQLKLLFKISPETDVPNDGHLFTAFPMQPFNYKHFKVQDEQFILDIDWDGQYQDPPLSLPTDGILKKSYSLDFLWHKNKNESFKITIPVDKLTILNEIEWNALSSPKTTSQQSISGNILFMLLFALIGGFILNFMPCVLPVISLKLYGLIQHTQKSKSQLIKHHGAYTLGVLFSFWILAIIILSLKSSGEAIGWGFQLQSPSFVWFMLLIFFVLGLNLFGLFEFKTPGGKIISNARSQHPYIDDFLSGLLAVVVATPCSAPFLGPALTYAFSENAFIIFLMFTAIGLGLSFPFIITAIFPKALKVLPKPGAWMNIFKYLMGLALFVSCIWLLEVLQHLGNFPQVSFLLYLTLILIFFSIFLYQKEKKFTPLVIFMFLFTGFNLYRSFYHLKNNFNEEESNQQHSITWEPWQQDKITTLLSQNESFFIDATAKWCITCQVNKKLVFETDDFKNFLEKNSIKPIQLDWTKKDPAMFQWMQQYGAVSVPAYFLGHKGKIVFLGETISISKIENALQNP